MSRDLRTKEPETLLWISIMLLPRARPAERKLRKAWLAFERVWTC